MSALTEVSSVRCFGGDVRKYKHTSSVLGCDMVFTVFIPGQASDSNKCPVLYFLSGLTCTDDNFTQKAGAQRVAAEKGIVLVAPDTSPRGLGIEGEDESWDFGTGAGFYLTATEEKWKQYNMFDYVTKELPELVAKNFPVDTARSGITGHSMGGLGSLVCSLKNPGMYQSVSAFAPICNPINCDWGKKAFTGYLGEDKEAWKLWDPTELVKGYTGPSVNILVDQGTDDGFYKPDKAQLLPENLKAAADSSNSVEVTLRFQEGYDHSYFFIASFIEDHVNHHAATLCR